MDSTLLLLCTYGSCNAVVNVGLTSCHSQLLQTLCEKWDTFTPDDVMLYYSLPGYNRFMLDNDDDFHNMVCLAKCKTIHHIDVTVVLKGNPNVDQFVGQSTEVVVGKKAMSARDDDDADLLAAFCPHNEKVLLSSNWSSLITHIGQGFRGGATEFLSVLCKYAVECGFRFKYVKNDSVRVTAVCSLKESKVCTWCIHARSQMSNRYFYIKKWNNFHSCGAAVRTMKNPRLGSELVSTLVLDRVRDKPLTRPTDVVYDIKADYGLDISYRVAWLGVEKARGERLGAHSTSFDQLRWYTNAVMRCNPGSFIDLQYDPETMHFKRIFILFSACIQGFNSCRPLLFLDGTFLKGRYKGHFLAAIGKDGNKGLFPLAYAIVDSENEDNWMWFLPQLEKIVDKNRILTFISDRNIGLLEAMPIVFPTAHHGYCLQHLKANMRDKLKGFHNGSRDTLIRKLNECAYAPTRALFHQILEELKDEGRGRLTDFFANLPHENWANAYFRGQRYGEMWSNAAESFNSWIREARHLPTTRLVEAIRNQIMRQMAERRAKAATWVGDICLHMETKLQAAFETSRTWNVSQSNDVVYEVHSFPSVTVDIACRVCSCFQWQLNGFPCTHAVVAILKSGNDLNACVDQYYHIHSYRAAYSVAIYPISTVDRLPFNVEECTILPPIVKRPPGRPKKQRVQSKGEKIKQIRCGRCGRMGSHNRKSCKEPI